jgi:prophage regulatory protein
MMDEALSSDEAQSRPSDDELWSLRIVIAKTGLSRSSIYDFVAHGIFPRQRRLGPRRVAWLASEVRAWIASRPC